ncbi:antirestriction protein ArdA [Sphingobacterium sp.]
MHDLPSIAKQYFDYEAFARNLFMTDYWFEDGFVFQES